MKYFAGLFDAEGYVTLTANGNFVIGMEMSNEDPIKIFQQKFGGTIDTRHREKKKKTWNWRLHTNEIKNFIYNITQFSLIKDRQLIYLEEYIDQTRAERKNSRSDYVHLISSLKKPENYLLIEDRPICYEWLAGLIDGDGNFCLYEFLNQRKWPQFASTVGIFSIYKPLIIYLQKHLGGGISVLKKSKNPVWKWCPSQKDILNICQSVSPYLIVKKKHCDIFMQYYQIKKPNRFFQYTDQEKSFIRDMIKQIKHLNSL